MAARKDGTRLNQLQQKAHCYHSYSSSQKGTRREMGNSHLSRLESSHNLTAASTELSPCRGPQLDRPTDLYWGENVAV